MNFQDFMTKVDFHVANLADGLTHDDFINAPWLDLWKDTNGEADAQDIIETLAEADALFQEMARLNGAYV